MNALKLFSLLIVFIVLVAMPVGVFAQDATPEPDATATVEPAGDVGVPTAEEGEPPVIPSEILAFVAFLALNAVSLVVSLEKFAPYQALPASTKGAVAFILIVVVIPFVSKISGLFLQSLPPETLATVNEYFGLLVGGWYMWSGSQIGYPVLKWLTAGSATAEQKAPVSKSF